MGTPSRRLRPLASPLSPEVEWYLESRGFTPPTCVPAIRTPEPRNVKGAVFDPARVDKAIKALRALRHTKGKWAGRPLEPTGTQVAYIIAPVFGWVAPNEAGDLVRIIREAYVEMPRKGAKTTLVSALAMILAFADDEPGAEVILGAASKDQAKQAYGPLEQLARNSSVLKEAGVVPTRAAITRASDGSFIKPVSSRGDLAHGANVHGSLVDELHVHKNPDLLEALESGTGARTQPLGWIITTADDGSTTSVYAQRRELIEKLAKKTLKAPAMYGVIFAAIPKPCRPCKGEGIRKDVECEACHGSGEIPVDIFDEEVWAEANPLYPVTPSPEYMRGAADKAKANPVARSSFCRLHLGIRDKSVKRFIDLSKWDRNRSLVDTAKLARQPAFGGLDLASVSDLTALAWVFPDYADPGGYDVLWRFWIPEEGLDRLDAVTSDSASGWVKEGWLTLTPGDVTDYDFIKRQIKSDLEAFDVKAIGYDRWNASQLVIDLEEKEAAPMVKVGQGVVSLSAPMKEMDRLIRKGTATTPLLRHGGNPVARWQADNLIPYTDAAGNVKPDKAKSMEKIDGMSALVTALAVAMTAEVPQESAYADRGLMTV